MTTIHLAPPTGDDMTALLTNRDALEAALHDGRHQATETTCGDGCPYASDAPRWADALIASGADAAEGSLSAPTATTLTEFLLARIADGESLARDMHRQAVMGRPLLELHGGGSLIRELVDPARVLSECEAKRRIIGDRGLLDTFGVPSIFGERILRALAMPYADHPDYRQEWKP